MKILITGGAGFIGSNTANYYLEKGDGVTVFDNLSRKGTEKNIKWLSDKFDNLNFIKGDVADYSQLKDVCSEQIFVVCFHLAAQFAVTTLK